MTKEDAAARLNEIRRHIALRSKVMEASAPGPGKSHQAKMIESLREEREELRELLRVYL